DASVDLAQVQSERDGQGRAAYLVALVEAAARRPSEFGKSGGGRRDHSFPALAPFGIVRIHVAIVLIDGKESLLPRRLDAPLASGVPSKEDDLSTAQLQGVEFGRRSLQLTERVHGEVVIVRV